MTVTELEDYGMLQMDGEDIDKTLERKSVGVLGVPTDSAPLLRPLGFWYDGESALYFVYVLGADSQKVTASDHADIAQFLVYDIETTFNWRSVLLTGTIERVPDDERAAIEERIDTSWKPDLFERAAESEATALYRFRIDDRTGIKQLELPPELRTESSTRGPD
ncbi:pyridoxamine 5'-phosphate oxidase family protein [Haloarcula sp. CBA1130]|uniref:pyridoxamine 5'-phosphate oxidase family protein n=1 Tax=unclassified Haloarcula TaxID=2624677 RepID=UPI001245A28F|nr:MULTISPECIES: pyridoxamine 5'-phosphate oxidase family protein [unclassified Haloarcula]KAA9398860.1 pyridoxamine 5'-phosphate oxidase family protein [Haloarcula sp. CBA1129]KAA9403374.1 pyridoxamine 5'-phosphate oxidase family protein [Haloarcula sp. CBA1130]